MHLFTSLYQIFSKWNCLLKYETSRKRLTSVCFRKKTLYNIYISEKKIWRFWLESNIDSFLLVIKKQQTKLNFDFVVYCCLHLTQKLDLLPGRWRGTNRPFLPLNYCHSNYLLNKSSVSNWFNKMLQSDCFLLQLVLNWNAENIVTEL